MLTKKRFFLGVAMLVIIIVILSTTIGRELVAGRRPGMTSFAVVHFAGYLFFLLMPVEALIPIYQLEGHSEALLIVVAVATAFAAQVIDYAIGFAVSQPVITNVIGEKKFERFQSTIHRHGGWAIFVFNLFPLSSPNMLLAAGIVRFGIVRAMLISTAGLLCKYFVIVYIVDLF